MILSMLKYLIVSVYHSPKEIRKRDFVFGISLLFSQI